MSAATLRSRIYAVLAAYAALRCAWWIIHPVTWEWVPYVGSPTWQPILATLWGVTALLLAASLRPSPLGEHARRYGAGLTVFNTVIASTLLLAGGVPEAPARAVSNLVVAGVVLCLELPPSRRGGE